jgi:hypothetical protein
MADTEELLCAQDLIARHEQWKLTLWAAAFSRKPLTVEQVAQIVYAGRCPIGRWLEAQAGTELGVLAEYEEVVRNHVDFHQEMMEVASMLTRKEFTAAVKAIQEGSSFAVSGLRLAKSILELNRVRRILATP